MWLVQVYRDRVVEGLECRIGVGPDKLHRAGRLVTAYVRHEPSGRDRGLSKRSKVVLTCDIHGVALGIVQGCPRCGRFEPLAVENWNPEAPAGIVCLQIVMVCEVHPDRSELTATRAPVSFISFFIVVSPFFVGELAFSPVCAACRGTNFRFIPSLSCENMAAKLKKGWIHSESARIERLDSVSIETA